MLCSMTAKFGLFSFQEVFSKFGISEIVPVTLALAGWECGIEPVPEVKVSWRSSGKEESTRCRGTQGCKGTGAHRGTQGTYGTQLRSKLADDHLAKERVQYTGHTGATPQLQVSNEQREKGRVDAEGGKFKEVKMCCPMVWERSGERQREENRRRLDTRWGFQTKNCCA